METISVNKSRSNSIEQDINIEQNAAVLHNELVWLHEVIHVRIALHFGHDTPYTTIDEVSAPDLPKNKINSSYTTFVARYQLNLAERLVLILALVPHLKPGIVDILSSKNQDYDRRFSEFGGLFMSGHSGLIPTAETALFILAGDDIKIRMCYTYLFKKDHVFTQMRVIPRDFSKKSAPRLSGIWMVGDEYVEYLINGQSYEAAYSADFPAERISTPLEWGDIVLSRSTVKSLQGIRNWITYEKVIMHDFGLEKQLKPGYKSLFYGPPGTGKTMTAALLGKSTNMPVYRVDLSMVVSKYIGETEKNLSKVFDQAECQNWILFFDEADSLFGKRTQVNSANDRFGNQEIGYLLQRIEDFPGIVILASNLKDHIDEAFTRRFQSMVEFRIPGIEERYTLWQQSFSPKLPLDRAIDIWEIAEKYELSGGLMMNVVRACTLSAVAQDKTSISKRTLETAIQLELQKEGIILN